MQMERKKDTSEFYKRLKKQLELNNSWPSLYLYKFIVPTSSEKIEEIESLFKNTNAIITTRDSSKGTYTSISIKVTMDSAEAIIKIYQEVSNVEGVISL